jgi:hypothetical protein
MYWIAAAKPLIPRRKPRGRRQMGFEQSAEEAVSLVRAPTMSEKGHVRPKSNGMMSAFHPS